MENELKKEDVVAELIQVIEKLNEKLSFLSDDIEEIKDDFTEITQCIEDSSGFLMPKLRNKSLLKKKQVIIK